MLNSIYSYAYTSTTTAVRTDYIRRMLVTSETTVIRVRTVPIDPHKPERVDTIAQVR